VGFHTRWWEQGAHRLISEQGCAESEQMGARPKNMQAV